VFVVIDGPDGAGKTTQAARLEQALAKGGRNVLRVREPGGTPFGEAIRGVLLGGAPRGPIAEALAFFSARAELLEKVVEPELAKGTIVVCERFVSSTFAYQVAFGGDPSIVAELERLLVRRGPDVLVLLDIDARAGLARIGRPLDAIESRGLEFHERVRAGFRAYAEKRPGTVVVDASRSADDVASAVLRAVSRHVG